MTKIVFVGGSPGSGKTTVSKILQEKLGGAVLIDFGRFREFHLDPEWSNANEKEEQMAFENLLFALKNYIRNGYEYVIVNDLKDFRIEEIPDHFAPNEFMIFSLFVNDDEELRARVLDKTRDSGFKNADAALEWNRKLINRDSVSNELKIDNTSREPQLAVKKIMGALSK